ncbi:Tetraspanin family protein [Entamoeba marina]
MSEKVSLTITILAAIYVVIGFFCVVASLFFTKDINSFERTETSKDGNINTYFTKASCVYLMISGCVCMLSGSLGMVGSLLEKQWSMMLYFMTLFVSLIIWCVLEGIFGVITFGLTAVSDSTMSATITDMEIRFHCCGWKTLPSSASDCAYPAAYTSGRTCIKELSTIWDLSIVGFLFNACYYYRKLNNRFTYSFLQNDRIDDKTS